MSAPTSNTPTNTTLPDATETGNSNTDSSNAEQDACKPPLFEIVHITGARDQLYFLTKSASEALHTECAAVSAMMQKFADIVSAEPDSFPSQKERDAMLKKRIAWIKKATKMGLVDPQHSEIDKSAVFGTPYQQAEEQISPDSCNALLKTLQSEEFNINQALTSIRGRSATSLKRQPINQLRQAHLQVIKTKLLELRELESRGLCEPTSVVERILDADTLIPTGTTGGIEGGITITELQRFSTPDTLFYLSNKTLKELKDQSKNGWIPIQISKATRDLLVALEDATKSGKSKSKPSDIVTSMITDFEKQLKPEYDTKNLRTLPWFKETDSWKWESTACHPFNAFYQDVFPKKTIKGQLGKDGPVFAASAEAQQMRFAAGANLGEVKWDPIDGKFNLTAKVEAKFSLFEGKIEASAIFPNEKGQQIYISFRGADKKERSMEMGHMRFNGKILMSVFAGVEGSIEGALGGTAYKAPRPMRRNSNTNIEQSSRQLEQDAGAGLLLMPQLQVETQSASNWKKGRAISNGPEPKGDNAGNAYASLKAEGFAGGKVGAAASLAAQWQALPKPTKDKTQEDQTNTNQFLDLAKTGVKGGASIGLGAGSHLKIAWEGGKFIIYIRASASWGLGVSGGFETEVDVNNILTLFNFILEALQRSDYRDLTFVDEETFLIMSRWLYKAYVFKEKMKLKAIEALFSSIDNVRIELTDWWDERSKLEDEAEAMAENIKNGDLAISLEKLPPETIGPMLYSLSYTFIFSFEESQETAIMTILNKVHSWRHFMQILKRMSKKGEEVDMYLSMQRLTSILDGAQYLEFINWTQSLQVIEPEQSANNELKPFTSRKNPVNKLKDKQVVANIENVWGVTIS